MTLFVCSPRKLRSPAAGERRGADSSPAASASPPRGQLELRLLERHPYTTQTFVPLGMAGGGGDDDDAATAFVVVVAPTRAADEGGDGAGGGMPDLRGLRAFVGRAGQAVTYAVGTWHAPMVVVGAEPVSFVVTQFANGVAGEDCEEVGVGGGRGRASSSPWRWRVGGGQGARL